MLIPQHKPLRVFCWFVASKLLPAEDGSIFEPLEIADSNKFTMYFDRGTSPLIMSIFLLNSAEMLKDIISVISLLSKKSIITLSIIFDIDHNKICYQLQ